MILVAFSPSPPPTSQTDETRGRTCLTLRAGAAPPRRPCVLMAPCLFLLCETRLSCLPEADAGSSGLLCAPAYLRRAQPTVAYSVAFGHGRKRSHATSVSTSLQSSVLQLIPPWCLRWEQPCPAPRAELSAPAGSTGGTRWSALLGGTRRRSPGWRVEPGVAPRPC